MNNNTYTHTHTHSLTHTYTNVLTHSPTHPLTHSLTHTHTHTHTSTHPLTHSLTSGRATDHDANWPGCNGRPALLVESDRCVLYFHCDVSGSRPSADGGGTAGWGFKLRASATCMRKEIPPPRPPLLPLAFLSSMKLSAMKALKMVLSCEEICPIAMVPKFATFVLPALVMSALGPVSPAVNPLLALAARSYVPPHLRLQTNPLPVVLESTHPYTNGLDQYRTVHFEGAVQLVLVFDPRCSTEYSRDYVKIFKDKSLSEFFGKSAYTGRRGSPLSNWPCSRDSQSQPLVIEASSFVLHFHSGGLYAQELAQY